MTGVDRSEIFFSSDEKPEHKFTFSQRHSQKMRMNPIIHSRTLDEKREDFKQIDSSQISIQINQVKEEEEQKLKIQLKQTEQVINIQHRFDQEFFQRLDTQAIGFSTILKSRKSSPIHLGRTSSHQSDQIQKINSHKGLKMSAIEEKSFESPFQYNNADEAQKSMNFNHQCSTISVELSDTKGKRFMEDQMLQIQRDINFKKVIQQAIILFKQKPRKAFQYLIEHNAIENKNSQQMAQFLLCTPGLSKQAVGQYLGNPQNEVILKVYCMKINFQNMRIDQALRLFLSRFMLPGEGQQIQRIIQAFSNQFYFDNRQLFVVPHTAYILAFTLIMVNTSEHNKSSKNRLTIQKFLQMNQNAMPRISKDELQDIYNSIKGHQIKTMPQCNQKYFWFMLLIYRCVNNI